MAIDEVFVMEVFRQQLDSNEIQWWVVKFKNRKKKEAIRIESQGLLDGFEGGDLFSTSRNDRCAIARC